jgi:hypothetical protein
MTPLDRMAQRRAVHTGKNIGTPARTFTVRRDRVTKPWCSWCLGGEYSAMVADMNRQDTKATKTASFTR